ncbi:hypothetical protein SAMN05444695_10756 [Rhodococcus triatomae]|uniref:Uncharacterized protein n=1 Tax=Rhodococcus triatomae TaxID=300028 RepID=A0A1G8K8H4_9NOCA|nr:hypothetical protein [Rhodococcus triatomae]QNG18852.1 hypothetical protein G4H72_09120 [Rhodococcus triatomae]SDI39755.1 hypothetical protein SAMN05444695_10756 [Rhodococcus triatomae]
MKAWRGFLPPTPEPHGSTASRIYKTAHGKLVDAGVTEEILPPRNMSAIERTAATTAVAGELVGEGWAVRDEVLV